jgi:hypothetical protein
MRRLLPFALAWAALAGAAAAAPAVAAPAWRVDALSNTTAAPAGALTYVIQITNVGDATADLAAHPLSFIVTLPAGLTAVGGPQEAIGPAGWDCPGLVVGAQSFDCQLASGTLPPSDFASFTIEAAVGPGATGVVTSAFTVAGGDASNPTASTVDPTTIAAAPPPFGIDAFDGAVTADAAGTPFTQAGGHPYAATVSIDFNTVTNPAPLKGRLWPVEPVRNVLADLPPGFVGDPTAAQTCTAAQLASGGILARTLCPPAAQVGTAIVRLNGAGARTVYGPLPLYNMVPPPDVPARFGFNVAGTIVTLDAELRSAGDYGLSARVRNVPQGLAIAGTTLTLWGVPAAAAHDRERACPGELGPWQGGPSCANGGAAKAFLRNPTSCTAAGVGLATSVRIDSWVAPGTFAEATFVSHVPPGYPFAPVDWGAPVGPTGCEAVPFDPAVAVTPGSGAAGAPSGLSVEVSLPQSDDPAAVGQSDLRRAVVRLPPGVRVNPSAADGLVGCSPADVGLRSAADATCPDGSRVGSVTIATPLLDAPLAGSVYLAGPFDNPFDSLLAVYLVARGPGLIVKLAGRVDADPLSGQLTAVFDELPQLPFSAVRVAFDGGPRAPLVNPPACGTYRVESELTGWSGAVVAVASSFSLGLDAAGVACPPDGGGGAAARPFAPGFGAGVESSAAGRSSPFHLRVTRTDADEELGAVTVRLPRGLLGRIADVELCSEADAAAGTCAERARVGRVAVGAGAGPLPFYIEGGRAYVTGPYRGAPFGLSIVVPAVAGPFDLGVVVVRAAIHVHRRTAALRVETDPLPTILQGIPLQVRDVRVAVDRPGFMLNPTSCAEKRVRGALVSVSGRVVGAGERFQAAECRRLPFDPRLRLIVGARGRTRRGMSTPLTAILTQRPGEANIRRVSVTLPSILNARLEVVADACTPAQFEAGDCERARVGSAVAVTPLLREPLRGGVYLVRARPSGLPDLVVALRGQVAFDLVGKVSVPGGRLLRATFGAVPDVAVRRFVLRLTAGRRGVVGAAESLCGEHARRAEGMVVIRGQQHFTATRTSPIHRFGC